MTDKKQVRVIQVHDHAFRSAMSDLRVAKDFLTHYLPAEIKEKVSLETLVLQKESYVDKELKLFVTDLLYSVELKGKAKETACIYFLFEHLSTQQRLAPWRILQYTCQIVKEKLEASKNAILPLIIPIVVYNGSIPYSQPISIYDLFDEEEQSLAKKYMFHQFQLIDFTQVSDEEMRTHQWSQLMELLLKHAHSREAMKYLESLSGTILRVAKEHADNYILSMLKYYIEVAEIQDQQRFTEFLHQSLPKPLEQQAMTLAQVWKNEGIQQGIQEGLNEGMQLGMQKTMAVLDLLNSGEPIEKITKTTGLNREQILEIKKHLLIRIPSNIDNPY
ncbi:MAG: Rpn family recombination-promoting nuclease/putative transposase [Gammaproteobacteria bacterium]